MDAFICTACGMQYAPSETPPAHCAMCEEERQYVPPTGQSWTTLKALAPRSFNSYRQYEPGVIGIGTQPNFAIGQRALLICTPNGNVLWDCIAMLDDATVAIVTALGGIAAIATVATDRKFLTFMRSYPNFIPLSAKEVEGIAAALAPFRFDTIYGHYFDRVIARGGEEVLERSVARYLAAIGARKA